MVVVGKNLFDFFPNKTKREILQWFNDLTGTNKEILIRVFGENLENRETWTLLSSKEREKVICIITLRKKIDNFDADSKEIKKNNIFSREKEIRFVKKTKLSYYDEVSFDMKELYLKYYFESFPGFKEKYDNSNELDRKKLLKMAIENSRIYRDKFVMCNQGLVGYVAKMYPKVPFEDAMQIGNVGLIEALKRFDLSKKVKFSTYAFNWIRHHIGRYNYSLNYLVRIPANVGLVFSRIENLEFNLYSELHRKPTDLELSKAAGCSMEEVERYHKYVYNMQNFVELDRSVEGKENVISDFVICDDSFDIATTTYNELMVSYIMNHFELDDKSRYVLTRRFGLDGEGTHTLSQIGNEMGISKQAVNTIEKTTIRKIRNCKKGKRNAVKKQDRNVTSTDVIIGGEFLDKFSLKILKMHYLLHMSTEEIARQIGIDVFDVITIEKMSLTKIKEHYTMENGEIVRKKQK